MTQVIAETHPTGQPPVTERPDISLSVCNIGKNADFRAVFLERRLYLCGLIEMKKAPDIITTAGHYYEIS